MKIGHLKEIKHLRKIGHLKSFFCLLMLFLLAAAPPAGAVFEPSCSVILEPDVRYAHPGDTFAMTVSMEPQSAEVYGCQYEVVFDPAVFEVLSQSQGPLLSQDGQPTFIISDISSEEGKILYVETRYGVKTGVISPNIVSTIELRVKDSISSYGVKEFALENVTIIDSNLQITCSDLGNGKVVLMEPVVSDFTPGVTEGEAPLTVTFTDASMNAVSWSWDFDSDGSVDSYVQNPEYTYNEPGTYTVSLTAANDLDTGDTITDIINVYGVPVADFTATIGESDNPLTVNFTDASNNAVSWSWDFDGDGSMDSEVQNPEYTYPESGKYAVSLTVANELSTIDMESVTIKVKKSPVDNPSVINSVDTLPSSTSPDSTMDAYSSSFDIWNYLLQYTGQ